MARNDVIKTKKESGRQMDIGMKETELKEQQTEEEKQESLMWPASCHGAR